jgi:hypothetical protein
VVLAISLLAGPVARGQSGVALSGIVSDPTGGPIPGASVYVFSPDRILYMRANENGHFEFAGLLPGSYSLETKSNGFKTETLDDVRIVDKNMEISITWRIRESSGPCITTIDVAPALAKLFSTVNSPSYEKRIDKTSRVGTVFDVAGTPLSNLRIYLSSNGQSRLIIANDKGEFRVDDLEPGKYILKVSREGYRDYSEDFWIARQNLTKLTFFVAREKPCG